MDSRPNAADNLPQTGPGVNQPDDGVDHHASGHSNSDPSFEDGDHHSEDGDHHSEDDMDMSTENGDIDMFSESGDTAIDSDGTDMDESVDGGDAEGRDSQDEENESEDDDDEDEDDWDYYRNRILPLQLLCMILSMEQSQAKELAKQRLLEEEVQRWMFAANLGQDFIYRVDMHRFMPRFILALGTGVPGVAKDLALRYPSARVVGASPSLHVEHAPRPYFWRPDDIRMTPVSPRAFDFVVVRNLRGIGALDYGQVFANLRSSVRNDAFVRIFDLYAEEREGSRPFLCTCVSVKDWKATTTCSTCMAYPSPEERGDMMVAAGFRDVRITHTGTSVFLVGDPTQATCVMVEAFASSAQASSAQPK